LEAKEVLVDAKKREQYDFWLNSGGMSMSWKEWFEYTNKKQPVTIKSIN
jgi:DnaJ-class molecular chaperone